MTFHIKSLKSNSLGNQTTLVMFDSPKKNQFIRVIHLKICLKYIFLMELDLNKNWL